MRSVISSLAFLVIVSVANADDGHWQSLFDGKSLEGWNAEDLDECFKVQDGAIVAGGEPLARLSYVGPVNKHDFKNLIVSPSFERLSNIWPQFLPPDLSRDNRAVQAWCSGFQIAIELTDLARIRKSGCFQATSGGHR
jgi:hypothetical protein